MDIWKVNISKAYHKGQVVTRLLFEPLTHQLGDASLQSIKPCVESEANYYGIYLPLKELIKIYVILICSRFNQF